MHGHKIVNQNHIHFIAPTVVEWMDIFSRKVYRDIIIESLQYCRESKGLNIHAYVIMTNHLHLVISAREGYNYQILSEISKDLQQRKS
ncbi:MAG: putative transposase [Saprospiraceae bacterium]|jgi:putative transposase